MNDEYIIYDEYIEKRENNKNMCLRENIYHLLLN